MKIKRVESINLPNGEEFDPMKFINETPEEFNRNKKYARSPNGTGSDWSLAKAIMVGDTLPAYQQSELSEQSYSDLVCYYTIHIYMFFTSLLKSIVVHQSLISLLLINSWVQMLLY